MSRPRSWIKRLMGTRRGLITLSLILFAIATIGLLTSKTIIPSLIPKKAEFYFVQKRPTLYANYTFPIELWVRSSSVSINAASAVLKFNPRVVDIVSMNTEQSFCSLYLENSFDTITGEVRVACGTPQPGFQGESLLVTVMVKPKVPGQTEVTLDPDNTLILANDRTSTNLTTHGLPSLPLTIKQTF